MADGKKKSTHPLALIIGPMAGKTVWIAEPDGTTPDRRRCRMYGYTRRANERLSVNIVKWRERSAYPARGRARRTTRRSRTSRPGNPPVDFIVRSASRSQS
jgi:hypothetical protein